VLNRHLDLFCQDKYLLNYVDLKIKLRRSRDAFALVADAVNYKIKIKEMALYVRKVPPLEWVYPPVT
jgi:hypothetical protein